MQKRMMMPRGQKITKKNTKKHCLTPKTLRLRSRGPSRYAKKKQKNHDDASRSGSKDE